MELTQKQLDEIAAKVAAPVAEAARAQAKILVDEQDNKMRAHVEETVKKAAAKTNAPPSVLENPNLNRWIGNQSASPLSVAPGVAVGGPTGRMTIQEAYEAGVPSVVFALNPAFRSWAQAVGSKLNAASNVSPRFTARSLFADSALSRTAGVTAISDIQSVLSTVLQQEITILPQRQIRTRDLFMVQPTDKQQQIYLRQTGFTNAAGTVPLNQNDPMTATAAPMSNIVTTEETAVAKVIAHWIPAPRSFMTDVQSLINLVETQGKLGVLLTEDIQLLSGGGTGNDLRGVLNDPAIPAAYTWSSGDSGDNMADALLYAIALSWVTNYEPDGIVLHPFDWMKIAKMKNTLGDYLLPQSFMKNVLGPLDSAQPETLRIWGLNTVRTTAMNTGAGNFNSGQVTGFGSALVGAFKPSAVVYDLEQVEMEIYDQHADFALKMMNVLYFYERLAFGVKRPEAFRPVTFDNAPTS